MYLSYLFELVHTSMITININSFKNKLIDNKKNYNYILYLTLTILLLAIALK